jgi:23S rRNA pseudouridine2605 synthase
MMVRTCLQMNRLQKIIAARGYCSRRKAEELMAQGRVKVNGNVITEMGSSFEDDVEIAIDNKPLVSDNEKYYYLFHKPRMVVTTLQDPRDRRTVADFFKSEKVRLYPVGRLDYDVSGALIMTNDGEFADYIMHPRYGIRKTYQALCQGKVSKYQIRKLMSGVNIDDDNYFTKALDAGILKYDEETDTSIIFLIISEGRKHHVKKMLIAADIVLEKLKRIAIEFLNIADVPSGKYRPLKPHEIKALYGIFKGQRRN